MLDVTCATPQRHGPLTVFPLIATAAPTLPYVLMVDALDAGTVKIAEIGSGSVTELIATNASDADVLILDGEQLAGAKQNRTTNRSLILPAKSETRIPVSCMEQGRWRHTGDDFRPTKQSSPTTVRRRAREVEADHARRTGAAAVSALAEAQGAVWSSFAERSADLGSRSPTGALDALYETRDADIEGWVSDFPVAGKQIGLLAFIGDRPLGLDVIGCTNLYAAVHGRLIRGYVVDALGVRSAPEGEPGQDHAQTYLRRVNTARRIASPTVGAGDYAVLSGGVIGGELTASRKLVHLSAFPVIEQPRRAADEPVYGAPIARRTITHSPKRFNC